MPSVSGGRFRQLLARDQGGEHVNARIQTARKIPLAKARCDGSLNDLLSRQIRNRTFKRFSGSDAHHAIILGNDDQQPIANVFSADFPKITDTLGVATDVFWRSRRHHQHDDL